MRRLKKPICILLSALMLMSALSGCAEKETPESERFVLRAYVCGRIETLDPAMNTDTRAESIFCALYENLMRVDDDGEGRLRVVPGVAKEYEEIANADGTVDYVFTLRSSARWSDGTRVKARDFAYAWRRLVNPETESPNHELLSMVQGYDAVRETGDTNLLAVKADGDTTFRVTLSAPCSYFLGEVCTAVATMPLRSDAAQKDQEWTSSSSALCNGPYQVSLWAKEEYVQLRRNPSYYEKRTAGPDVLRFLFCTNAEEAWRLYEEERLDYTAFPPERAEGAEPLPLRSTACVLYNHMSEVFSNEHVRRAFDLSLDRVKIAAATGTGAVPATGLVPSGVVNAEADEEDDFRAAGGTLCAADEEGYSLRCLEAESELRTGGYWGAQGFPTVNCLYVAGDEARAIAAETAAVWHEQLGVAVTTEGLTREEFDRRVNAGDYDLAIDMLSAYGGDAMEYLVPFEGADGNNALHYVSRPYDLLIGVAESSRDAAARAAFLHDAEELLLGDAALSPLCFRSAAYVLRPGLSGVRHDLRGNAYFTAVARGAS